MSDGVAISAGTGTTILTDDTGAGGHAQVVKLAISTDGSGTLIPATAADGITVNLGTNNDVTVTGTVTANLAAGTNNIGDVDIVTVPAPLSTTGTGTEATALRVTIATDSTGVLSVDDNGGALTVDNGGTFATQVTGDALTALQLIDDPVFADDAAFTVGTSKVAMAGVLAVAHGTNPDVADALDAGALIANRHRIPFMLGGHPNLQSSEYFTSGAATDDNILPAISAGTIYVITGITVTCSAANATSPSVRIGFGATTVPAQGTTNADAVAKVVLSHPGIAPGSGIVKGHNGGIIGIGGDGEELRITCTTPTTSMIIQVDWFSISS